jgi:hypothetical protein
MLFSYHNYATHFCHASKILCDYPDVPDALVRLQVVPGQSSSQYVLLTSDKVVVILPGDGMAPQHCDILLHSYTLNE